MKSKNGGVEMEKLTGEVEAYYIKQGGTALLDVARDVYADGANRAFEDAIGIGIRNTVSALYEANVSDDKIIHLLNKYWGIPMNEAEDRLLFEKSESVIRALRHYLKMQGYSQSDVQHFMITNKAIIKIKHDRELWKMKDNPEKLFKAVQSID